MDYREEAIECVKDHVLPIHKQIYAKYDGEFDRIYSEGYNSRSYQGRVIEPGKVYELSYLECSCPKVKSGLRSNPEQCECSRQSILYILSQLEPDSRFDVRIESTILRGSDRCSFRITRHAGIKQGPQAKNKGITPINRNCMKLSTGQKRRIKSLAMFTGIYIVVFPLMTLVAGRQHWTWGEFFQFAGITIFLYGLIGFFYILGSKIPKKDK